MRSVHNNLKTLPEQLIRTTISEFLGESLQTPPMFSGLKINGQKLYKLARKGISIPRRPRKIFIYNIELLEYANSILKLSVICSKGTYIRTLIEQIGEKLSVGAYVKDLRRVAVGRFEEDKMVKYEHIKDTSITKSDCFIGINNILSEIDSFILTNHEEKKIRMGQPIYRFSLFHNKLVTIYNQNNIIGIGIIKNNYIYPKRLINFNE